MFAFFVEISTGTPHQHPCRTFVLVFGRTLEIKKLEKNHFEILPKSYENDPSRPVIEGFELIEKSSQPF